MHDAAPHIESALPRSSYDRDEALAVLEPCGITRAALLLHKGGGEGEGAGEKNDGPMQRGSFFCRLISGGSTSAFLSYVE